MINLKIFKNINLSILYPVMLAVIRMSSAFLVAKIASSSLSINDFGKFQQFLIYFSMINMLSTGGISNLIVKNISDKSFDSKSSKDTIGYLVIISTIVAVLHFLGNTQISIALFGEDNFSGEMVLVGASIIFLAVSNLINAIQVGEKLLKEQFIIAFAHNLLIVFVFYVFSPNTELIEKMTLYVILLSCLAILQMSFYKLKKISHNPLLRMHLPHDIDFFEIKRFLYFATATLIAIISFPASQTYTRNLLMRANDWTVASLWQASLRITDVYMQIAGTIFLTYYFAIYAKQKYNLKIVFSSFLKIVLVISIPILVIYGFRDNFIEALYTKEYTKAGSFFIYQIGGDIVKLLNLSFSYFFLAKGKTGLFIVIDLMQSILWVAFSHLLFQQANIYFISRAYIFAQLLTSVFIFSTTYLLKGNLIINNQRGNAT